MIDVNLRWAASLSAPQLAIISSTCLTMLVLAACAGNPPASAGSVDARVTRVLQKTPLVDGHNDLRLKYNACRGGGPRGYDAYDIGSSVSGHTDLPRWKLGGVGAQLLNSGWLAAEPDLDGTLKGFAFTREMATRYPDRVAIATTSDEIRAIHSSGRLAILIALENPNRISVDEATIKRLAAEGLRSEILAYDEPSELADGHAGPARFGGLSAQGQKTVRWMQESGILVDLSHASANTARDVLDQAIAPVIFSHSSTAALCDVSRNVPDDVLRRLTANGGVVMISFVPAFTSKAFSDWYDAGSAFAVAVLKANGGDPEKAHGALDAWESTNPQPKVAVADVADHIEHVRDVAGIDHVGFGSDFDGIDVTVAGLEDVSKFPNLLKELARRGWSDADLRKVAGENFLRVLDAADAVAKKFAG